MYNTSNINATQEARPSVAPRPAQTTTQDLEEATQPTAPEAGTLAREAQESPETTTTQLPVTTPAEEQWATLAA